MIRAYVIETLTEDYVRTARAKGASEARVLRRHVIRNALLPVVTILGMDIGLALGGAFFTETVFGLPGLGRLAVGAINSFDLATIAGGGRVRDALRDRLQPRRRHALRVGRPAHPAQLSPSSRKRVPGTGLSVYAATSRKPSCLVQRLRGLHAGERVEPHRGVAQPAPLGDRRLGQSPAEAAPTPRRLHVEALHLARPLVERPHADAPDDPRAAARHEERPARRRVRARQVGQLVVEPLEAEVDRQRGGVLARAGAAPQRARPGAQERSSRSPSHDVTLSARIRHRHVRT